MVTIYPNDSRQGSTERFLPSRLALPWYPLVVFWLRLRKCFKKLILRANKDLTSTLFYQ
jgi:hypothetical protein